MDKTKPTFPAPADFGPVVAAAMLPHGRPQAWTFLMDGGLWLMNDLGQTFLFSSREVKACVEQLRQQGAEADHD